MLHPLTSPPDGGDIHGRSRGDTISENVVAPADVAAGRLRLTRRRFLAGATTVAAAGLVGTRDAQASTSPVPRVAFTWDGPFSTLFVRGLPMLRRRGFLATVFVRTAAVGQPTGSPDRPCTWSEIDGLAEAGWEVSNHTVNHPRLDLLTEEQIVQEVLGAKQVLVARGYDCPGFAYPFNISSPTAALVVQRYEEYARRDGEHGLGSITSAKLLYRLPAANLGHKSRSDMVAVTKEECFGRGRDLIWWGHVIGPLSNDGPGQTLSVDPYELRGYLNWVARQVAAGRLIVDTCRGVVLSNELR
jgi:Polysaccharide deacetylase